MLPNTLLITSFFFLKSITSTTVWSTASSNHSAGTDHVDQLLKRSTLDIFTVGDKDELVHIVDNAGIVDSVDIFDIVVTPSHKTVT